MNSKTERQASPAKQSLDESALDRQDGAATLLVLALAILAGLSRLLPHPPNVTLLTAAGLIAGALLPRKLLRAQLLIFVGVFISDLALGLHSTLPFVYLGLVFGPILAAWSVRKTDSTRTAQWGRSALVAGGASFAFFVISNVGVFLVGGLYPMTLTGLMDCFVMALPFWRSSLIGDLGFGIPALIWVAPWLREQLLTPVPANNDVLN